ncbi:MAG: transcription termination/antitermination protein NusG [Propionibacteriaceae bacterium]|nr:transcription termination/antitermination protein NusG [Propionibacteriaceae bacterium]
MSEYSENELNLDDVDVELLKAEAQAERDAADDEFDVVLEPETASPDDSDAADDGVEVDLGIASDEADEDDDAAGEDADTSADEALEAALGELRDELEGKFGDWYAVHTYSGMENRVKQNIEARAESMADTGGDDVYEVIVPTEDVVEVRNNNRKTVTRSVLPGYVFVRMDMTDESWGVVHHTPSVTGFVGAGQTPVPLSVDEVLNMLTPSVKARIAAQQVGEQPKQKKKVEVVDFQVGDSVMVTDGPFSGVHATITEINANTNRLRALVEILGRETPVDLEFRQVSKVV